ncbi:MAG TPA: hypothetical protein VFW28_08870 [Micropepsaceae bacterium]|nr:hypothetical protein [Micropepsaceae bacterium]
MADPKSGGNGVQGEGDYRSAREYQKDIGDFMKRKSGKIDELAKEAGDAMKGPEAEELKKAEEKGKSKARH